MLCTPRDARRLTHRVFLLRSVYTPYSRMDKKTKSLRKEGRWWLGVVDVAQSPEMRRKKAITHLTFFGERSISSQLAHLSTLTLNACAHPACVRSQSFTFTADQPSTTRPPPAHLARPLGRPRARSRSRQRRATRARARGRVGVAHTPMHARDNARHERGAYFLALSSISMALTPIRSVSSHASK